MDLTDAELGKALMRASGFVEDPAAVPPQRRAEAQERLRLLLIAASWRVWPPDGSAERPPLTGSFYPKLYSDGE